MSWKVIATAPALSVVGESAVQRMQQAGCQVTCTPPVGPFLHDALLPLIDGADAVLAGIDPFDARTLESSAAAKLKIVSRWGVGYDSVNLALATKLGIVVTNTPGLLDEAVADYTFALLLSVARGVHEGHLTMRQGTWTAAWGGDVYGKTLGIIGFGHIGRSVARRALGFGMRLVAFDVNPGRATNDLPVTFVSLDELLKRSDFVCLHAALTPESRGMIGRTQLRRMKPTAYFINTARGALVDEAALLEALQGGWIAGAALDAFATEPLPAEHPLRTAPRLLLTPHQASFGRDTGRKVSELAAQAIVDLQAGRTPEFVVNRDVLGSPALRAKLK